MLQRYREDVGRDPAEITKTRLGQLVTAPRHEAAMGKAEPRKQCMPD